ncbi:MAG: hypothetical protein AAFV53_38355 [Myxococcota bacterium]
MRILFTGTRDAPPDILRDVREKATDPSVSMVISGAGGRVDHQAIAAALQAGKRFEDWPALWDIHGKSAGPRRNIEMLDGPWTDYRVVHHEDYEDGKVKPGCVSYLRIRTTEDLIIGHRFCESRRIALRVALSNAGQPPGVNAMIRPPRLPHLFSDFAELARSMGFGVSVARKAPPPDQVWAWWDGVSVGTHHTITEATKRGIPVVNHWRSVSDSWVTTNPKERA